MKKSKKATSIVEAMIIMLIIITGVVGMYNIYGSSIKLSNSTENKITAISIAREGIEAITNIRDTNNLLFKADLKNCWNVLNYNANCIGDNTTNNDILSGSYIIYKNIDDRWIMNKQTSILNFSDTNSRNIYKIGFDKDGFYTGSGIVKELKPIFTREIRVNYDTDSNDEKIHITSSVIWMDSNSTSPHEVSLNTTLTNWKK